MSDNHQAERDLRDDIKEKIQHILQTYPKLNPSMLQQSLGSSIPSAFWKPVLESLIEEGIILREKRVITYPNGREQPVTLLSYNPKSHKPPKLS